jgi:hypothetical protein
VLNRLGFVHEWTGGRLGGTPAAAATQPPAAP